MSWLDRQGLARRPVPDTEGAILLSAAPGEAYVPMRASEIAAAREISRATLGSAGLGASDRVIVALNSDGDCMGASLAEALAPLCRGVATVGARGRMRLLASLKALRANALIITPTGALDFLARLYLEVGVDPLDLDLERILLVGEIASPGTTSRLAGEFEVDVVQLYCDPFFGVALAHAGPGALRADDALALGELGSDTPSDQKLAEPATAAAELVLRPTWSKGLADSVLRTGQVRVPDDDEPGFFNRTAGEHLLVRGRWLSLPLLRKALRSIDGISSFTLDIERANATLDSARLTVGFVRESLVGNEMWEGRLREAIASITPIAIDVAGALAPEPPAPERVNDRRGHHLGVDRSAIG